MNAPGIARVDPDLVVAMRRDRDSGREFTGISRFVHHGFISGGHGALVMKATTLILVPVAAMLLLVVPAAGTAARDSPQRATALPATERSLAPYFRVAGSGESALDALPLRETVTRVAIAGVIAAVEVRQVYVNRGAGVIEAVYVFPASTRAAVHGMEMRVGDRVIRARMREKKKARAVFERAKAAHRTASLLEQQRPNVFQMSVANIHPGDEVSVTLRYSETIPLVDGVYEFVYPAVVGPRFPGHAAGKPAAEQWVANPHLGEGEASPAGFRLDLELATGMPIRSLTCPSHQVPVAFTGKSGARLRVAGNDAANRDVIVRYQLADEQIVSGLLLHEGRGENFFLLNVEPPEHVLPEHIPPRDYVFVVDVSGSMNGFPLDLARALFRDLIGSLRPVDSFNILLFASGSESMSRQPLPATGDNVRAGIAFLENRCSGGGTRLVHALDSAIGLPGGGDRSRSVIVITDGFITMEADAFRVVRDKLGQANLFAFGIGSSVNRHLIEGLAAVGGGEPFVVTRPSEAPGVAQRLRDHVSSPVLTNIRVEAEGVRLDTMEPAAARDVFAARPLTITGRYHGDHRGRIIVSGLTGGGREFRREFALSDAAANGTGNPALRSLWARERVRTLADYADLALGENEIAREITNLGMTYELLTPYTSFVAIDERIRRVANDAGTVRQPLPLPDGVPASAVGGGSQVAKAIVSNGSVPEPGPIALLLATCGFLLCIRSRRRAS